MFHPAQHSDDTPDISNREVDDGVFPLILAGLQQGEPQCQAMAVDRLLRLSENDKFVSMIVEESIVDPLASFALPFCMAMTTDIAVSDTPYGKGCNVGDCFRHCVLNRLSLLRDRQCHHANAGGGHTLAFPRYAAAA